MHIKPTLTFYLLASSICFTAVPFAANSNSSPPSFRHPLPHRIPPSNFLLGGELGYNRQKEEFNTTFNAPGLAPAGLGLTNHSEKVSDKGISTGLLAGWQYRWERVLLGIEGGVNFQSFNHPRSFFFVVPGAVPRLFSGTAYYDRGPIWALTGRLGYFITPGFMPYIRVGGQMSEDEVNYQVFAQPSLIPPGVAPDFTSEQKKVYGVVAAAGVEFPTFIGSSTVRLEYTFSRTESIEIKDSTLPILGVHKFRHPETNILKVSWVWNFL